MAVKMEMVQKKKNPSSLKNTNHLSAIFYIISCFASANRNAGLRKKQWWAELRLLLPFHIIKIFPEGR